MQFFGNYGEPTLKIIVPMELLVGLRTLEYLMEFNPKMGKWTSVYITEQG